MDQPKIPYDILELLLLRTLDSIGSGNGLGVPRRIELTSESLGQLNQGSIHAALLRLQEKGWIETEDGPFVNGRKANFYSLTAKGRKHLGIENWEHADGGEMCGGHNVTRSTAHPASAD